MITLSGLDPATYQASALHAPDRTFREANCYVDIWIELLHSRGINPASAMAFAPMADFEGDQWTFFKPPAEDLLRLYGIDVHEMQLYRPVVDHIVEQLKNGRAMILEGDAFYMPDTAASSYRRAHVKSSFVVESIDRGAERLRYFHSAGFHELSGEDYRGLFRLGKTFSDDVLPPYVELVRFDAGRCLSGEELKTVARKMLCRHLTRRPERNPWLAFGQRLARDLPQLLEGTDSAYHLYAFATVRQCGAAFELAKSFVEWLAGPRKTYAAHAALAAEALGRQVDGAKTLLFRLARRRAFDPAPAIQQLAADWDISMNELDYLSFGAFRAAS